MDKPEEVTNTLPEDTQAWGIKEDPPVWGIEVGTIVPILNIVEFEFLVMSSLREVLGDAFVTREHGTTRFSFPVMAGSEPTLKRATVKLELVDVVICKKCNKEIEFPGYSQEEHIVGCPK